MRLRGILNRVFGSVVGQGDLPSSSDGFTVKSSTSDSFTDGGSGCLASDICADTIAQTLAKLKWGVYRVNEDAPMTLAREHSLSLLLNDPNGLLSRYDFMRETFRSMVKDGEALLSVRYQSNARMPVELRLARRLADTDSGSTRRSGRPYRLSVWSSLYAGGSLREISASARDVIHLRYAEIDVSTNAPSHKWLKQRQRATSLFNSGMYALTNSIKNGLRSPGWIMSERDLNPERESAYIKKFGEEFRGAMNTGSVPLMPTGMEFRQIQANPVDQYLISGLRWALAEVARMYHIPLGLIYTNSEIQPAKQRDEIYQQFLYGCIKPIVESVSDELTRKLLPRDELLEYRVSADLKELELPTLGASVELLNRTMGLHALTPNDYRKLLRSLNLEEHFQGDELGMPERLTAGDNGGQS